ncbi:hypothetical protein K488DRAFT_86098 [Vararia minispora EC-137]|uniref:Uncharacterized protein n=1 Tax=Vararia minispora EC-137 TaxID=1314806 RepID=A0ACB8QKJ1_9AGAM|nr:hypothetical protein K488DRAFT_86098 [Vararia minispora EC-137]
MHVPPLLRRTRTRPHDLREGEQLDVLLYTLPGARGVRLTLTITHAFRPFTMSPVFRVLPHLASRAGAREAVLKLFDRRSLTNAREEYRAAGAEAEYDERKEEAYRAFCAAVAEGGQRPLAVEEDPWDAHERVEADDGALEAYLAHCASTMFTAERAAYARLRAVQGDVVPRAYGTVVVHAGGEIVRGLLLENVRGGVSVERVVRGWKGSREEIGRVCEEAVGCVRRAALEGFVDEDVRAANVLVRRAGERKERAGRAGRSRVVLVDLADGRVRGRAEDDAEWAEEVRRRDPAAALGRALEALVKECVGEGVWRYEAGREEGAQT